MVTASQLFLQGICVDNTHARLDCSTHGLSLFELDIASKGTFTLREMNLRLTTSMSPYVYTNDGYLLVCTVGTVLTWLIIYLT
jgi:hypothetical protein